MAFNQERAAQSFFNSVMCCSGPFSAYRWEIFNDVAKDYINQRFLGKACTYGDDRHLTNLVLSKGFNVTYNHEAEADTEVPTTIKGYLKQQLRWNKSFYREMLWTPRIFTSSRWYLLYEVAMQFILPFMLLAALTHAILMTISDPINGLIYLSLILLMALIRVSYAIVITKDLGFLRFLLYGLLHVVLLIPVRIFAILTIQDRRWGCLLYTS